MDLQTGCLIESIGVDGRREVCGRSRVPCSHARTWKVRALGCFGSGAMSG